MTMIDKPLDGLERAAAEGRLTPSAVAHIRAWLTKSCYAPYAPLVAEHISQGRWKELEDAFWTVIPFGTGGRRGRMYPIGTNAINDRTIGESARGLADYVKDSLGDTAALACAIAYDTRHRSAHFARLCAEIMVASGFKVFFLDGYRSTPELSFAVRRTASVCGIMVTASHNPPSDNAVKVYWSTGGQVLPPHDAGVIQRVMQVQDIEQTPFAEALAAGRIVLCQEEIDEAFVKAVRAESLLVAGDRSPGSGDAKESAGSASQGPVAGPAARLKVVYSPLHGVGATAVCPVLAAAGFSNVEVFAPHAEPNGDFPNVPGHVSNPENPAVFDAIVARAVQIGADLVLASDPDCDRIGCAAPLDAGGKDRWATLSGNQIGALLAEYILAARQKAGSLPAGAYVVKTLVTTDLVRRIAAAHGAKTYGDLLVGFKWIGGVIDQMGPDQFVFGTEESHGYLVGTYARDKDGAVAAMLLAELAAVLKAEGRTLHDKLDDLFRQHGPHAEKTISRAMPGAEGMEQTRQLMQRLRDEPPRELAGMPLGQVRDYLRQTVTPVGRPAEPLAGPKGDLVILDLVPGGNYVAVRPSGTEPKVKFYLFAHQAADTIGDLAEAKAALARQLQALQADLSKFVEA